MSSSKPSVYQWFWIGAFAIMLTVGVPSFRMMTIPSISSTPDFSLEVMCRAQFGTENFSRTFLNKIESLPKDRAILLLQTSDTKQGIPSLLTYLAWPRPVLVRTGTMRDSVNVEGLLRSGVSAVMLANQEAPPNFPSGELLTPTITYIRL